MPRMSQQTHTFAAYLPQDYRGDILNEVGVGKRILFYISGLERISHKLNARKTNDAELG